MMVKLAPVQALRLRELAKTMSEAKPFMEPETHLACR